ncbi:MAG TPA: aldo/keto reductase [Clostridiales bacterium]|nr:aldo/keto reductase [Clostridiales bacterium]
MKNIQYKKILSNGVGIPCVGYGTWKLANNDTTVNLIKTAIDCGYRHIDTAAGYDNHVAVGKGVRESGLKRDELFVTSKLNNPNHGYDKTMKEFDKNMTELDIDYIDLHLIHWPNPIMFRDNWKEANAGSWKAFEELYNKGLIKAIGLSNFLEHHIDALMETATITPMVNQLELHPLYPQKDIVKYCRDNNILVEAWSPMVAGDVFDNPLLIEIAKKYNKSVAQLLLRWSLDHNFIPLPKASNKSRMIENADIFDFTIDKDDIEKMTVLEALGRRGAHPDTATF